MSWLLEINDCGLSLSNNSEVAYRAPAIAIVRSSGIVFGDAALRQARVHPRQANSQYLARLNADPLPEPVANAANHADLVYLHLQEFAAQVLASNSDLVLAVPGFMSNDQLGVLLGIIQETGITVGGFVDAALAATSLAPLANDTQHVDIHLQRTCLTDLQVNEQIQRRRAEEITEVGLNQLLDAWVNVIADTFVRDTRFDPLHAAETEQQLYNQVYDWVTGPGAATQPNPSPEISIDIDYQEHVRHVDISRGVLESKAQQRFQRIFDAIPASSHVTLSARSAGLPGLQIGLQRAGHNVLVLGDSALADGFARQSAAIRSTDGQLRLVSSLARVGAAAADDNATHSAAPAAALPPATHLLDHATGLASSLGAPHDWPAAARALLRRSADQQGWELATAKAELNEKPGAVGAALKVGDELTIDGGRYQLIAIRS